MLANQRLFMTFMLALSSLLLGILTALMVWSLQWALESREAVTYEMPGDITVLWMYDDRLHRATDRALAQEELITYLNDQSLSLIISSYGDGVPEMLVYDPHGLISWFPRINYEDICSTISNAYLFEDTYSARRWAESGTTPLLPRKVVPEGVIIAPRGVGTHQYARPITSDPLPPGNYTINTINPDQVRHVLELLHRMGLAEQRTLTLPLVMYLISNPLFVITVLFLIMGHVCAVLYWSLYLRGRIHEFSVRSRHGARPMVLVWENLMCGWPGLVAGSSVGVIVSGFLVATIGQVSLTQGNFQTLAGAVVVAVVVGTATWSATLYAVIRPSHEVNLNA